MLIHKQLIRWVIWKVYHHFWTHIPSIPRLVRKNETAKSSADKEYLTNFSAKSILSQQQWIMGTWGGSGIAGGWRSVGVAIGWLHLTFPRQYWAPWLASLQLKILYDIFTSLIFILSDHDWPTHWRCEACSTSCWKNKAQHWEESGCWQAGGRCQQNGKTMGKLLYAGTLEIQNSLISSFKTSKF